MKSNEPPINPSYYGGRSLTSNPKWTKLACFFTTNNVEVTEVDAALGEKKKKKKKFGENGEKKFKIYLFFN